MEPMKLAFSEQLLHTKRTVASKFSLSVGASLFFIALMVIFTLCATPLCLKLSSSPVSLWPFSSWSPANGTLVSSSAPVANLTASARSCRENATSGVGKALSLLDGDSQERVLNTNNEANVTSEAETERVLGNPVEDSKNRSLTGGSFGVKTHEAAGKLVDDSKARHEANLGEEIHQEGGNFSLEKGGRSNSSSPVATEESSLSVARHDPRVLGIRGGKCDIFYGRWVRDELKPYYPANSCPHVDRAFNCHLNGRPDAGFVKWKWQPNGCDLPRYVIAWCFRWDRY